MKKLKRQKYIILLLTIVCVMTIGFAVLSSSLSINGSSTINSNSWDVHFENIVLDSNNTVTGTQTITSNTSVTHTVTLNKPGDYYSFTVDVVNEGSIDAMVNSVNVSSLTEEQDDLVDYTVKYSDNMDIQQYDKLEKTNGLDKITVILDYDYDLTASDLPTTEINLTLSFEITYVQADSNAVKIIHDTDEFISLAKAGNLTNRYLGKTIDIDMGTYGKHKARLSNISTPSECSTEGFSQSGCGVVMEFADVISKQQVSLNLYNGSYSECGHNVGGYPASNVYSYVKNDLYNALPTNIKNAIIDTTVVSGHGSEDTSNFTTTEKLFLLSAHEVHITDDGDWLRSKDTTYDYTRQLDIYTNDTAQNAIKKYNGIVSSWWTRTPNSAVNYRWLYITYRGSFASWNPTYYYGISPAFRIA